MSEIHIKVSKKTEEQQILITECSVVASPPATFEWFRSNDSEIFNDSRVSITYQFTSTDEPTSTSILTIRNVTVDDGGDYICTAENSLTPSPVSASVAVNVTGEHIICANLE